MVDAGWTQTCVHLHVSRPLYHSAMDANFTCLLASRLYPLIVSQDSSAFLKMDMKILICVADNLAEALLTLTVLITTTDAQWEGMGDVGSARYEPTLLPPCPTIRVLSYSN